MIIPVIMTIFIILQRTIDILKIDIETHEWLVIDNILKDGLLKNVRQLQIEWHFFNRTDKALYKIGYDAHRRLTQEGFHQFHMSPWMRIHDPGKMWNSQADSAYVNYVSNGVRICPIGTGLFLWIMFILHCLLIT